MPRFFVGIVLLGLVSGLFAYEDMINYQQMKSFKLSPEARTALRNEIRLEVDRTVAKLRDSIEKQMQRDLERIRNANSAELDRLREENAKLTKELTFLRELVVETNYQRNLREDRYKQLKSEFEALKEELKTLQGKKAPALPAAQSGEKL